jgi:hypothetical protein
MVARDGKVSDQDAGDWEAESYQTTPYDLTRSKLRSVDLIVAGFELIISSSILAAQCD